MPPSLRSLLPPQCLGSDSGGRTHNVAGLFRQAADLFLGGIKIDILTLVLHTVFRSHDSVRSGGAHAFRRAPSGCDVGCRLAPPAFSLRPTDQQSVVSGKGGAE